MSQPGLSVLIAADESLRHLAQAIEQVRQPGLLEPDIVVVCGPSIDDGTRARAQTAWPAPTVRWIVATRESPGALRNAGVQAAAHDLVMFLEAGDLIDRCYLHAAAGHLTSHPDLDFVTAWAHQPGPSGLSALIKPRLTLEALLADPSMIPGPTVVRRSTWEAAGRFDEALPCCEWYDLWIRLLAQEARGEVIAEPLIGYRPSRQSAYRRALNTDRLTAGMRAVLEKHLELFRRHVATVLCDRDISLRELNGRYQELLRRRDALIAERAILEDEQSRVAEGLRGLPGGRALDWGDLRRVLPLSPDWGYQRGTPVDRYYIERFLAAHADDVHGAVLEVQESDYTQRFGGDRVVRSDVIDIDAENPRANLTADLRRLEHIPSDRYDCFVLTQTIHMIDDMRAVLREALRIVKPGGVLLVTLPCASRICLDYGDGDFWRVTEAGARRLFLEVVPSSHLTVQPFGNVLTNVAFLEGLACHEISAEEFETHDPLHPLLIGVRAVKPGSAPATIAGRPAQRRGAILLYHRVARLERDVHGLAVTPDDFRAHMMHIASAYRPMPLPQLAMAAREGWLPDRAVAVTFDDGYVENLEIASPMLLELGIPATFFVTSLGLPGGGRFWWDTLASIFFGSAALPARLEIDCAGEALRWTTATAADRQQAHWDLYHRVRTASPGEQAALLQQLTLWAGPAAVAADGRPMTQPELVDLMGRAWHSIGGHGTNHLSFSAHGDDVIRRDVRDNRILLEAAIGCIVTSFAYPYGDHDDRSVEIVRQLGYRVGVTCVEGLVRPGADPLRLPRIVVRPGPAAAFEERLKALFDRPLETSP